jgi:hypothetical protein
LTAPIAASTAAETTLALAPLFVLHGAPFLFAAL